MKQTTYTFTQKEQTGLSIGEGLLEKLDTLLGAYNHSSYLIVVDKKPSELFLKAVTASLKKLGKPVFIEIIPGGEESKQFKTLEYLLGKMHKCKLDRKSAVVALGGGVVGDIATVIAGLYYRGIDCIQIPTTLLSQVDSALGGKGGVNFGELKNTIGLIRQPRAIIIDTKTLETLPKDQLRSGMGEVVKYAISMDKELFDRLEKKDIDLVEIVEKCIALKLNLVQKDPQDTTGIRAIFNFGHTLGQAVELQTGLLHGNAIAVGMTFAVHISIQLGMINQQDAQKALALLQQYELPIVVSDVSAEKAIEQMKKDKKSVSGTIKFVLLEGLGKGKTNCEVDEKIIQSALKEILV